MKELERVNKETLLRQCFAKDKDATTPEHFSWDKIYIYTFEVKFRSLTAPKMFLFCSIYFSGVNLNFKIIIFILLLTEKHEVWNFYIQRQFTNIEPCRNATTSMLVERTSHFVYFP